MLRQQTSYKKSMLVYMLHWFNFRLFVQYNKHLFVHIGQTSYSYNDALLETVDIRQIYDKFPEKKGGLKELFGKGPQNAFFLVKFWVSRFEQSARGLAVSTCAALLMLTIQIQFKSYSKPIFFFFIHRFMCYFTSQSNKNVQKHL